VKRKLQVFISSTFSDLALERQAAVTAVLKAGHIPAGMELFTAGDRSQMVTIRKWIDESDVYMLILGGRYGSIEKASGISYTELEYDYALQQSKPIFAVVITRESLEIKIKAGGTAFVEMENPKHLAAFREKVLSNISSFFEDPKDVKLCVHESLTDFAANRELKGWVSAVDVFDTQSLVKEISKLSDENRALKETVERLGKRPALRASVESTTDKFTQLFTVARAIKVDFPVSVVKEGGQTDLLNLFFQNKEMSVNGLTNRAGVSADESWLYHTVCPKLQVHGLIVNEKVSGARYRRSSVSSLGREFLAHVESTIVLAKQAAPPAGAQGYERAGKTKGTVPADTLQPIQSDQRTKVLTVAVSRSATSSEPKPEAQTPSL
jgi:hypothetical protein